MKKLFNYEELCEDAKLSAYDDWLHIQEIVWEEEVYKGDTSREFFESEYADDCQYHSTGAFFIPSHNSLAK